MDIAFIDLAQTCAPMVETEILAGVVSLESRFGPFSIRINGEQSLLKQPSTKAEAIEVATSLASERKDIRLGLGGIGMDELQKQRLSISDAFDPCTNLRATATLLDEYYRLAVKAGADPMQAGQVMLQSWYGRDDASVGAMVKYDRQVRQEAKWLGKILAALRINDGAEGERASETRAVDSVAEVEADAPVVNRKVSTPPWDVFNSRRRSSVLVFQNSQMEQSE